MRPGPSFRKRAETRQRDYRRDVLQAGWAEHEHWLNETAVGQGKNFVDPAAHAAARKRAAEGKRVGERTFFNMLSSQAMCFNIFTPLADDLELAREVLAPFVPELACVRKLFFEYTPSKHIFRDQSGRGGVDCDLLIEAELRAGVQVVIVIETKFVEPEFSGCGFRAPERAEGAADVFVVRRRSREHRLLSLTLFHRPRLRLRREAWGAVSRFA